MKHGHLMQQTGGLCPILTLRSTHITIVRSIKETGDIYRQSPINPLYILTYNNNSNILYYCLFLNQPQSKGFKFFTLHLQVCPIFHSSIEVVQYKKGFQNYFLPIHVQPDLGTVDKEPKVFGPQKVTIHANPLLCVKYKLDIKGSI